ncbi:MAG: hypothetical protein ABJB05_06720 [Parafilimonas sp.]
MKISFKPLVKSVCSIIIASVILASCTATVKIPKHPAPGQAPPPPPKVEIHNN